MILLIVKMHLVLRIEWRLNGQLKDLRELIKTRCSDIRAGQSNNIWGRSQIHSLRWSVQKGESFKPSLNEWLDNRECPMCNMWSMQI